MNIYTVSFFGHRQIIENTLWIEKNLEVLIDDIIRKHEYVEFLVGRDGDFDIISASVVRRVRKTLNYANASLILVLPYPKATILNHQNDFLQFYDNIEICESSCNVHYKSAIQNRNKSMTDRSNLVVFYVQYNQGGAYQTLQYAKKQHKNFINMANFNVQD